MWVEKTNRTHQQCTSNGGTGADVLVPSSSRSADRRACKLLVSWSGCQRFFAHCAITQESRVGDLWHEVWGGPSCQRSIEKLLNCSSASLQRVLEVFLKVFKGRRL